MLWIVEQNGRSMINTDSIVSIGLVGVGIVAKCKSNEPNIVLGAYRDEDRASQVFVDLIEKINLPFPETFIYMPEG